MIITLLARLAARRNERQVRRDLEKHLSESAVGYRLGDGGDLLSEAAERARRQP